MLRWSSTLTPQNMWFEHDDPQDHLLLDSDGPAHFLLVLDQRVIGYFDPWHVPVIKLNKHQEG